ncbi:fido domain-containing protein, partial [Armillaria fumosa]
LKYCAVGVTRQATQINVTARLPDGKMIRFCPYTEVDSYMAYFCHRFNSLDEDQLDVYACAAWISQNFIDVHPFEDGNGRLSRMLASIPLVRPGFPSICVTMGTRSRYISALN